MRSNPNRPLSQREGMIAGAIWSCGSVGWIAAIALVCTWIGHGWAQAFFWFGLVLLFGAVVFAIVLVASLAFEILNITTRKSRRDALRSFSWAFLYNLLFGGVAVWLAVAFGEPG